jgi:sugar lactone lactonase YvrE
MASPDSFYVTNDHKHFNNILLVIPQILFRLSTGNVVFYDGKNTKVVAKGLKMANGLAFSKDEKLVYVSETTGLYIRVYERTFSGGLRQIEKLKEVLFKEIY